MKKILFLFFAIVPPTGGILADTVNINWIVDGSVYDTTTCTPGDSITPPTPPAKYGYTFREWLSYTPIEYLQSTGTQYIDTGVSGLEGKTFEIDLAYPTNPLRNNFFMNGWGDDAQIGINSDGRWWNRVIGVHTATLNTKYNTKLVIYDTSSNLYVDDVLEVTTDLGRNHVLGFGLFAAHNTANTFRFNGTQKIYACKIYNADDTLVRDFIPVLDMHGVACMYDRVTRTFFYNAGTGNFIAGPAI